LFLKKFNRNGINTKIQKLDHQIKSVENDILSLEADIERSNEIIKDKDFVKFH